MQRPLREGGGHRSRRPARWVHRGSQRPFVRVCQALGLRRRACCFASGRCATAAPHGPGEAADGEFSRLGSATNRSTSCLQYRQYRQGIGGSCPYAGDRRRREAGYAQLPFPRSPGCAPRISLGCGWITS